MAKPSILDRIMDEHICLPGFPQIIVTRGWLYQFLKSRGWCPCERGFTSLDYAVFGPRRCEAEATDEATRDYWIARVEAKDPLWTREKVAA